MNQQEQKLTVGRWQVVPETDEIVSGGERRKLDHTVMQLLLFLLHNRNRDLAKDEILTQVWGEGVHSEEVLTVAVSSLRKALDDDFRRPRHVKTIPRYGYRMLDSGPDGDILNGGSPSKPPTLLEALHERIGLRFLIVSAILFILLLIVLVVLLKVDIR